MAITREQQQLLNIAFRPHAPIEDPRSFFGRDAELARVRGALGAAGLQVVVYGEAGCGKTSLANVATKEVPRVKVFCEEGADFGRILRDTALQLQKLYPAQMVFDAAKDTMSIEGAVLPLSTMTGNTLLSILPAEGPFCIILDELDRVRNERTVASIAEFAKNLATNRPDLTLLMVGVADTAAALLRGHASNFRNMLQVQLDRMADDGLRAILAHGEEVLNIEFSDEVTTEILELSDRMPYFLHLLAKNAAKVALDVGTPIVEPEDLRRGCTEAASEADQQLRDVYEHAILSERGSLIYQRIIWAMASLPRKANNVAEITTATNKIAIAESDLAVTPQAIGGALRRLASDGKRFIITQKIPGVYCFTSPLMRGFIRLVRYRQ